MEQRLITGRIFICLSIWIFTSGCSKQDPSPEHRDPIYSYFLGKISKATAEVEARSKELEEVEKQFRSSDPNTIERKDALRKIEKNRRMKSRAEQWREFYKIRAERRRVEGRRAYKLAFEEGKDWPDPKEFERFMASQRLSESSRNWSERVPKLQDRISAAWPNQKGPIKDSQDEE